MDNACRIREVLEEDLSMLLSWRNHEDVWRYMLTQHEISLDEHLNWFAKASADYSRRILIVEDASGPFGYVQFSHVVPGGVADWGFYVRPNAPQRSGRKLGKTALDYAFNELKLHKVCGQAIESNLSSIAFHKRLGFMQEGILRDQQLIAGGGGYYSLVCFGLLAEEWELNSDVTGIGNGKN